MRQWASQTEWGSALGALDSARASVQAAEARLAELQAGPKEADLQAAQAAVDTAKAALGAAQDRLGVAEDIGNDTQKLSAIGVSSIGQAGDALRAAQASYDAALARLAQLQAGPQAADIQGAQSAPGQCKGGA